MASLTIDDEQDVVVVGFKDVTILDDTLIQQIGEEFKGLTLQAASGGKLLLDFSRVGFMSSAMIGQIVKLHKNCKRDKIKLKLCKISPNIFEVFQITGLNKLLDIQADREHAMAAFGPPPPGWKR